MKEEDRDRNSLFFKLKELGGKRKAVGDSGYNGESPGSVLTSQDGMSSELKTFIARAKNRHETLYTRLKSFNLLSGTFRHGKDTETKIQLHNTCVGAITVIVVSLT